LEIFVAGPPRAGLEHQYPEENAENQNNQEKDNGDAKQDFRDASGAGRDIRETENSRDHRYDKKIWLPT